MTTRRPRPRGRSAKSASRSRALIGAAAATSFLLVAAGVSAAQGVAASTAGWSVAAGQLPAPAPGGEVLREIRVHGNYVTPDADVIRLAGLALGQAVEASTVPDARARLERSRRFASVEIRKRYRSLDDASDVALVIVVQEHPTSDIRPAGLGPLALLDRAFGNAMFMPILNFTDGYGLTYGARTSFVDALGSGGRLSVPFTWGGTKRVAAEAEKALARGPIDAITATASLSRRTNPHYETDDDRAAVLVGVSRRVRGPVRATGHAGFTAVTFGALHDRFGRYGIDVTADTRADPAFPRNAVLATVGWEYLGLRATDPVHVLRVDARGYLALVGQSVLAVRAQFARADRQLPPYERLLLGGAESLRGYRTGTFAGDSLAAGSLELRIPTSSPLSFARAGVDVFADVGAAVEHGEALGSAAFHPGFGGGVFLVASIFRFDANLAVRPGGGLRLHVISGIQF